jgi:hypothetical protein
MGMPMGFFTYLPGPWPTGHGFKGTQDWEFFLLQFWNLRYFFVSYVKILRFYRKIFFYWAFIGGGTIFPRSPRTTRNEKNFWARSNFFYFSYSIMDPKYDPILVFWKFNHLNAPGTTLCVDLGSQTKRKNRIYPNNGLIKKNFL